MIRQVEEKDFGLINHWRAMRKLAIIPRDFYPPDGLIDPEVASGFLILTNTGMAFLDHFLTNPKADQIARHVSVLGIATELEARAKQKGAKHLMAMTIHNGIRNVCFRAGFKSAGTAMVMGKEI